MRFTRRRLVLGTLVALLVVISVPMVWLGVKWNRALTNVNKMIVTPVSLPTSVAPQPTEVASADDASGAMVAEPAATMIPLPDGARNILLVGTDARPGDDQNSVRTDTIVWVHLDPVTNHVSMLSFPRDLYVNIPGFGKNRINTAYSIGERKIGPGYGPALLKKTVSELVGTPVDNFVMINFDGFKKVIDTLGGIYIDVPKTIDDAKFPIDEYPGDVRTMKIHFDAGRQLMDSERALQYARTRHQDSDFGRNQRQQQVLMAIFDRVREQGLLGQLTNLDQYTEALSDYVRTDISRSEMLRLASMGSQLDTGNIQRFAIDSKMVAAKQTPAYVLVLTDRKALNRLVNQMIDPSLVTAGGESAAP
jgi:polyisoprenyl-teichoic acid--peptidoglycan teichoic acid transferase